MDEKIFLQLAALGERMTGNIHIIENTTTDRVEGEQIFRVYALAKYASLVNEAGIWWQNPHFMTNIFSSRTEYREYVADCKLDMERAWPFRQWFETFFYYEMTDQLPVILISPVNFERYRLALLN